MKNSNVLRRFVQGALALGLLLGFVAAFVLELEAQKPLASAVSAPAMNAAEQDLRMLMQELERERLEPLNTDASMASLCMTNTTAEQDMRMVMQEYQCERFEPLNETLSTASLSATNAAAEQDMRMVMQELERERLDQLNTNPPSQQFSVVRAMDESSIACLELRPSCDR